LYTPEQVVSLARRSGLPALAITDHDTLAAFEPARHFANGAIEIISGVEISTVYQDRELHLLAYFFDHEHAPLRESLDHLRKCRRQRFFDMADRLRGLGVLLDDRELESVANIGAVGRRHLAYLVVAARKAATVREAFIRYLGDHAPVSLPKVRLPVAEAIALVRDAGGVTSWAHPGADCTWETLTDLYNLGMRGVEVDWPTVKAARSRELRNWAQRLGLAVTGGSDCHGPDEPRRAIGLHGITVGELAALGCHASDCTDKARSRQAVCL
jgi:predicted metal-dependent phosphoesterase TrpH